MLLLTTETIGAVLKGEKKIMSHFFIWFFQLNTYALTVHGWYVSTLTKLGTAAAAVSLNKMNRWREQRWEKNISNFCSDMKFFQLNAYAWCHGWYISTQTTFTLPMQTTIKTRFWGKGEIVGWEKDSLPLLNLLYQQLILFSIHNPPSRCQWNCNPQTENGNSTFTLFTPSTIENRGCGHMWGNICFHFPVFSGACILFLK